MFARRSGSIAVGLLATLALVGCAGSSGSAEPPAATPSTAASRLTGAITVSAAASLTEAFTRIGREFEAANPGVAVTFNFGSSGTLATQIVQGAPADVFASADPTEVDTVITAGHGDDRATVFAKNELEIVTKRGNPKRVETLADLADAGVVSLCGETVPCGKYAAQILAAAGVTIPTGRITRSQDVKAALAAVTTGDADAAIVYATDAKAAGSTVTAVRIPPAQNAIATYPIIVLKPSGNTAAARAFVRFVAAPTGEATLRSYGFLRP